ncbi:MAG: hypothetical protein BWY54_00230 [Candidatus Dependentiae bacterium ADurb.Bin331]|nr:MAG: hypothetical protein BWY54_00230 [Candidatus Dependentiae bacterium ADurb.Bin331]
MNTKLVLLAVSLLAVQQSSALVFEEDRMVWDREEAESLGLRIPGKQTVTAAPQPVSIKEESVKQQPIKSMFESTSNKYWWETEKESKDAETLMAIFKIISQEMNKLEKNFVEEMWSFDLAEYALSPVKEVPHLAQLWKLVNTNKNVKQFKPALVSIFSTIQSMIVDGEHVSSHSSQLAQQLVNFSDEVDSVVTTEQKKDLVNARDISLVLMCSLGS